MEKQILEGRWIKVETSEGDTYLEADLFEGSPVLMPDMMRPYVTGEIYYISLVDGWGARFSAPGYLDCTPWEVFDSEQEATQHLIDQDDSLDSVTGPAYWASYIINGDDSSLEDDEISQCDKWLSELGGRVISCVGEWEGTCPVTGLYSDLTMYVLEVEGK